MIWMMDSDLVTIQTQSMKEMKRAMMRVKIKLRKRLLMYTANLSNEESRNVSEGRNIWLR